MSVSCTVSEIFSVKEWRDLETGVGVVQSHWKFLIDYTRLFIGLPLYIYSSICMVPFFELRDIEKQ